MVFGLVVTPQLLVVAGAGLLALLAFQFAVGRRWIKLGKKHLQWHRRIAWALLAGGLVHAFFGLALAGIVSVG